MGSDTYGACGTRIETATGYEVGARLQTLPTPPVNREMERAFRDITGLAYGGLHHHIFQKWFESEWL